MAATAKTKAARAAEFLEQDHSKDIEASEVARASSRPANAPTSIRLSEPLLQALDRIAAAQHRKRGNLIQYILWEYVRENERR